MDSVERVKKTLRGVWPIRRWFKPQSRQRLCRTCRLPYFQDQEPELVQSFCSERNNVTARVYRGKWPGGYAIRLGRWDGCNGGYTSDYVSAEYLQEMADVICKAHRFVRWKKTLERPVRRFHRQVG